MCYRVLSTCLFVWNFKKQKANKLNISFWEHLTPQIRKEDTVLFFKNISLHIQVEKVQLRGNELEGKKGQVIPKISVAFWS